VNSKPLKAVRLPLRVLEAHSRSFLSSLRNHRPETRGTYQRALREFIRWCAADRRCRFRVQDIERYKAYLVETRQFSAVSVSTYLTALRRLCAYLVAKRVLRDNPAASVPGFERPRFHSRDSLGPDDVQRLLLCLVATDERGLRDRAIILLMLTAGLAEIEIVRADVGDLSGTAAQATLSVQGKGHTRKDEVVSLPVSAVEAVQAYLMRRGAGHRGDPLFLSAGNSSRGNRLTTRAVRDRVNFYLRQAGISRFRGDKKVSPYSLRHTAAVLLARGGATADEIREKMRLGTVATAKLYLQTP
jgi:integrase/recombinase XerC